MAAAALELRLFSRTPPGAYGAANERGLELIEELAGEYLIETRLGAGARTTPDVASESDRSKVEVEVTAALDAGLPASFVEDVPLPYPTHGAVRFDDQAEFQPYEFLMRLADALDRRGSQAVRAHARAGCTMARSAGVETDRGTISAGHAVVANHPAVHRPACCLARMHPERSYCLAARIGGAPPNGMSTSALVAHALDPLPPGGGRGAADRRRRGSSS